MYRRNLSWSQILNLSDDGEALTPSANIRCLKSCHCGHVVEEWGRTETQARKLAQAKYELHYQEAHGTLRG